MKVFHEKLLVPFGDKLATVVARVWQPDESRATVFCIHAFESNGSDFDYLAQLLVRDRFTVVAPDIIGRGKSTFLGDPAMYTIDAYLRCLQAMSRYAGAVNHFLGTSWGGAILMFFLYFARIKPDKLILNDVGLHSATGVQRALDFLREDSAAEFDTLEEARAYVRRSRSYLGKFPEELWQSYLDNKIIVQDGKYRLAYDPASTENFLSARPYDLLPLLEKLDARTLLLFGAESRCYDEARIGELMARNPRISCIPNLPSGHHPSLMTYEQALPVIGFLNSP
jgi:pimeloyl-ACP methyl ester carboxylesterase